MTTETPILTRYLYEINDVKYSLFVEMLNKNSDKVLFWTYELYYSGWIEVAFEWALTIYDNYYREHDPSFAEFIQKQIKYYRDIAPEIASNDTSVVIEPDTCIGNIFINMMHIQPVSVATKKTKKLRVMLRVENIQKYLPTAAEATNTPPRNVLAQRCVYGVHKPPVDAHVQRLGAKCVSISPNMLNHWLYYASFSPIWGERIAEYNGEINHERMMVDFASDDLCEAFSEKYGYEPDEQSNEIHLKCGVATDR